MFVCRVQRLLCHRGVAPGSLARRTSRTRYARGTLLLELDRHDDDTSRMANTTASSSSSSSSSPAVQHDKYMAPSAFAAQLRAHAAKQMTRHTTRPQASTTPAQQQQHDLSSSSNHSSSTTAEQQQQRDMALRDVFAHARRTDNVRLRKDARVYARECAAFRAAHGGRPPRHGDVARDVHVPLAPVAALRAYAHTSSSSTLHTDVRDALRLQHAIAQNELVRSDAATLVRCLRCFHVYTAAPRALWGSAVQQSWHEYEKACAQQQQQQQQRPHRSRVRRWRRDVGPGVIERTRSCCPHCRSTRAQWAVEYVHHRTHCTTAPEAP